MLKLPVEKILLYLSLFVKIIISSSAFPFVSSYENISIDCTVLALL